jgi:hypothetical protein
LSLVARLERPLPGSLPVGSATAVFCTGVSVHPRARIERLEILVDGVAHPPAAFGMPRPDAAEGSNSGFWGTVPIPASHRPRRIDVGLRALLEDRSVETCSLGGIDVVEREQRPMLDASGRSGSGTIAVCMATFEPDPELLRLQLESLRAQTDDRWICLISDDCSDPGHFEQIRALVGEDPRFVISRSDRRLGFYRNFERALRMAPADAELVSLCDQDDRWHPDKLQVLRDRIGDAMLVYSDQRLVGADGRLLRETLWKGRRNNYDSLASMLVANTITGAAMLLRSELLDYALPFPDPPGFQFHDHWLALVALAVGNVSYVDRPLYDYVQHPGAVFGDVTHGSGPRPARGSWRAAYFYGYLAREVQAQALLARCGSTLSPPRRRALERFIAADSSLGALAWLASRPLRRLLGRTETLDTEVELAQGIAWKRAAQLRARLLSRPGRPLADASIPPPQSFSSPRLRRWRSAV